MDNSCESLQFSHTIGGYHNEDQVEMPAVRTLYMRIPTLGSAGTDGKWEGIEDNLWNARTRLSKSTEL
jgi:hypothetical protein